LAFVELQDLSRNYGDFALKDISFSIAKGETLTLMGPSGSGKTSVLRNIAGFDRPDRGLLLIDGRDVTYMPVHRRGVGMIFQELALFPNMNVFENIAYGLRARRMGSSDIRHLVSDIAARLRIEGLLQRYPHQLSGGERQKTALARSIVTGPSLLLLDEPMSSVDSQFRLQLRAEIKRVARELDLTMIFVTHDRSEGLFMADRVGMLFRGRLCTLGTPREIFRKPANGEIASFLGYNVVEYDGRKVAFLPSEVTFSSPEEATLWGYFKSSGYEGELCRSIVITEKGEEVHALTEEMPDAAPGDKIWLRVLEREVL